MKKPKSREWLVKLRGGLTQEQVATKSKLSRSYYTEIETGEKNPSVDAAKRIAMVLGFSWIIFFEDNGRDMQQTGTG